MVIFITRPEVLLLVQSLNSAGSFQRGRLHLRYMKTWMFVVVLFGSVSFSSVAFASGYSSEEAEEVPYDQLVRELNSRVSKQQKQWVSTAGGDPFEKLQIHFSLGFVQTVNTLLINDRTTSRMEDGLQLGVGIDLFSPEWVAEGTLKNFGQSTYNDSTLALREFDLRLSYLQKAPQTKMKVRFANGLGARYLRYRAAAAETDVYQTTPVYSMGLGFLIPVGSHFDLDFEFQGHLALINESMDRHGLALILRLDNIF